MRDCYDRCAALVLCLGLVLAILLATAPVANAQSYEEALAKFAADSYNDTDAAVAAVAASGNPLAAQVIEALQDGRLLFSAADKKVYIKKVPAGLLDAATGQAVAGAEPAGLNPVRVNNRVRRAIEAAIGSLTLLSPDPAKRYEAAKAVFKSKDASMLADARDGHRQGNRRPREEGAGGGARRHRGRQDRMRRRPTGWRPSPLLRDRGDQDARSAARGRQRRPAGQRPEGGRRRHRRPSTTAWPSGAWRRTSGTGCRSARCCCSPPSALPSPSASWASSTWRTARW